MSLTLFMRSGAVVMIDVLVLAILTSYAHFDIQANSTDVQLAIIVGSAGLFVSFLMSFIELVVDRAADRIIANSPAAISSSSSN